MTQRSAAEPVRRLVAVLWADADALEESFRRMSTLWGPIDFQGPDHAFDVTDYYQKEMGMLLRRRIIGFERLMAPELLPESKIEAEAIERSLSKDGRRVVNLDVGYLDHAKVVLASFKPAGQKIALGKGVYADPILRFRGGRFQAFEWTFPDFRDGRYDAELSQLRRLYLDDRRERSRGFP